MQVNDFLLKFKEQYIDADEITLDAESNFREIGSYDSLTGMALIVMIKDEFNIDITNEQWKQLHTVNEVYNFINNNL